ncbi:hypothetical protein D3C75_1248230 [compost metagenome]
MIDGVLHNRLQGQFHDRKMHNALFNLNLKFKIFLVTDILNLQVALNMLDLFSKRYDLPPSANADPKKVGQRTNHSRCLFLLTQINHMFDRSESVV